MIIIYKLLLKNQQRGVAKNQKKLKWNLVLTNPKEGKRSCFLFYIKL